MLRKAVVNLPIRLKGTLKLISGSSLSSLGAQNKDIVTAVEKDIRRGLIMSSTQSIVNFSKLSIDTSKQNMVEHVHLF